MAHPSPDPARPISQGALRLAVARGVIDAGQAQALAQIESEIVFADQPEDDEKLRFITGFGDIFVTIGIALFLGAVGKYAIDWFGAAGMSLVLALMSWGLAEFFTRARRMALPSIVLLVAFAASVFTGACILLAGGGAGATDALSGKLDNPLTTAGAGLLTAGATALHYWRFRVPITVAAGAGALVAAAFGVLSAAVPGLVERAGSVIVLVCGLAVFVLAMRFDVSDPQRLTRRTDIAFWLHLLAAPMIVHPLVGTFLTSGDATGISSSLVILLVFAALAVVAVLIDRRAILVSGLSYAGYAFATLVGASGLVKGIVPLTVLVLGALVLLLSAGWHRLRRVAIGLLPPNLARRLPGSHLRDVGNQVRS